MPDDYRFRLPIKLKKIPGGFVIQDSAGKALAYIYGEENARANTSMLKLDEAEDVAKAIARMIRASQFPKF